MNKNATSDRAIRMAHERGWSAPVAAWEQTPKQLSLSQDGDACGLSSTWEIRGTVNQNVEPSPGALSTPTAPW